jgi:hypothetical protein
MEQFSCSATCDARGMAGAGPDGVGVCSWPRRLLHGQVVDLPMAPGEDTGGQAARGTRRGWQSQTLLASSVVLVVLLGLGLGGGCTHVVREDAHYFVDGKDQLDPPNGVIPAGTGVWIIGKDEDYKRVWTLDFVIGYVWEDSVVTQSEWRKIEKRRKERDEAVERQSEQKTTVPLGQR